jgi:glutaredoxin 2
LSRLYIYDHCPFCIRTQLVAHYRQVPDLEQVILLNDDEETCHRLIGKKMVPIFEHDGVAIGESMDIAKLLNDLGEGPKPLRSLTLAEATQPLLQPVQSHSWALTFPRITRVGMQTFATEGAREYFRNAKETMLGCSFEQALADTDKHKAEIERVLAELPPLTLPSTQGNTLSWSDVLNFPPLHALTVVKGLAFPPQVRQWLEEVAELGGVELYFDRAI